MNSPKPLHPDVQNEPQRTALEVRASAAPTRGSTNGQTRVVRRSKRRNAVAREAAKRRVAEKVARRYGSRLKTKTDRSEEFKGRSKSVEIRMRYEGPRD